MLRVALFLSLALGAFGQNDAESLHIHNTEFRWGKKSMLQVHTRARTRDAYREFFQFRFGPIYFHSFNKRVTGVSGYYFIDQRNSSREFDDFNRFFGGALIRVVNRPNRFLEWRNLVERFNRVPGGDFTRVRSRWWLEGKWRGRWMPYTSVEGLYAQEKATVRAGAGLNRRMNRELFVGIGYEMRQYPARSLGHVITTNVTFQPGRIE